MPLSSFLRPMLPLVLLLALQCAPARGEIIYDNSATGGTNVYYSPLEYGDEIVLAKGAPRVLNEFLFEYYGDFTPVGDETARLRVYKNDGPGADPTPFTVLYDSGEFAISPGYQYKTFSGLNVTLPDDVTWTVQFNGLLGKAGDQAGLIFRNPPTVGSSYDDFWQNKGGTWQLFSWNGAPVANFAARIVSGVDAPSVSIRREASKVVVEWTGLSILQVSTAAGGPYTDLPEFRNRYVFDTTTAAVKFWRLRMP